MDYLLPIMSRVRMWLCTGVMISLIAACGGQGIPVVDLEFPCVFDYNDITVEETHVYVLTAYSYEEIPAAGYFTQFNALLEEQFNDMDTLFSRIELLNDREVRLYGYDPVAPPESMLFDYIYYPGPELLYVGLGSGEDLLTLKLTNGNEMLQLRMVYSLYSYRKSGGVVDYGSLDFSYNGQTYPNVLIESMREKYDLRQGDTIALGFGAQEFLKN